MSLHLVTGAAGFIGSHIAEALVSRGDQVRALDNLASGDWANLAGFDRGIEKITASLTDATAVAKAVGGVEVIFHQAALASVPRSVEDPLATHEACVTGTVVLLDAARKAGVKRVVFAASSAAYGDLPALAKRETDMPQPISPYAAAKTACEQYCQSFYRTYGLETVCLRYFNVFGPRQDPNSPYSAVIPLFITRLLSGERPIIYGDGHQSRDFTFVTNVVDGNLLAAETKAAAGLVINLANGRSTSLLELLDCLQPLLGTRIEPDFQPPRVGDVRDSLADITVARSILRYEPRIGLEEGIRQSIGYYRELVAKRKK
jgi:UDP-glucose 4-epimerase